MSIMPRQSSQPPVARAILFWALLSGLASVLWKSASMPADAGFRQLIVLIAVVALLALWILASVVWQRIPSSDGRSASTKITNRPIA